MQGSLWPKIPLFLKSKMADGRQLENTWTAISRPIIDRFAPNLVCRYTLATQESLWPQIPLFLKSKMAGRPPSWKYKNSYISATNWPICNKFAVQIDIGHERVTMAPNLTFAKIQDGGRPPSWRYKNSYISAIYWPICTCLLYTSPSPRD